MRIEEVRQGLESALVSTAYPFPPLKEVARQLHRPVPVLQHLFPEQCDTISQRYQQQLNPDDQQKALDALLADPERHTLFIIWNAKLLKWIRLQVLYHLAVVSTVSLH